MQAIKTIAIVTLASAALAACATVDQTDPNASSATPAAPVSETVVDAPVATDPAFFVDWTQQAMDGRWFISEHNTPNGHWESDWRRRNVRALPNGLNIQMTSKSPRANEWPWSGGEIQTRRTNGFGEYQVIMRAAEGAGLIGGFFTHTGPYYGTPHDQIDVTFVGKDPYQVQFNALADNIGVGVMNYPLDFDVSKNFALYSFIWAPDRITWYVNGEFAYEVSNENVVIPQTPGKLFANLYQARNKGWAGQPDFLEGATATYRCMSYRPLDDTSSRTCADAYESYVTGG